MLRINTLIIFGLFIFLSCEKEGNEKKISDYNKTDSHNTGQNCMNCHQSGGSGEGWFTVAGSVYNEALTSVAPNTTVKLYTGANGTGNLVATIKVDGIGNFYTTEKIDFGSGLYPAVQGATVTKYMGSSVSDGACYKCHNSTVGKIWTK